MEPVGKYAIMNVSLCNGNGNAPGGAPEEEGWGRVPMSMMKRIFSCALAICLLACCALVCLLANLISAGIQDVTVVAVLIWACHLAVMLCISIAKGGDQL